MNCPRCGKDMVISEDRAYCRTCRISVGGTSEKSVPAETPTKKEDPVEPEPEIEVDPEEIETEASADAEGFPTEIDRESEEAKE